MFCRIRISHAVIILFCDSGDKYLCECNKWSLKSASVSVLHFAKNVKFPSSSLDDLTQLRCKTISRLSNRMTMTIIENKLR